MRCLLDTNTCIDVMRNHPVVVHRMSAEQPDDCAISAITSYELYTGVEKCAVPERERTKVELLLRTVHELAFDEIAARNAARIRAVLEARGQAIGPYDMLLAGHAIATSLVLVTSNTAEFSHVPGLIIENWQSKSFPDATP